MSSTPPADSARARGREHVHANVAAMHAQFHFPSAFEVDGWIYLSGVIAVPRAGETSLVPAYERALGEIGEVLAKAGSSWHDVVKMTSFHKDVMAEAGDLVTVKDRVMPAPYAAWTAVNVASLADPEGVTEIEVIARKRG
jgi:enamine deaminase RidA (YjgF/YER057c/UK114 family)